MFQEPIGKITADHLRAHNREYLDIINEQSGSPIELSVAKKIEVASVVGGLFTEYDSILPQYGIDITDKSFSPSNEDLYTFLYAGQINGLVHGSSQDTVDKLVHRHGAAVELFVRNHQTLHQVAEPDSTLPFTIVEFVYSSTSWSGAEDLGEVEGRQLWLAGFSIDVAWLVSEEGWGQHG